MKPYDILKSPFWLAEIATGTKSFVANPILGNPKLNERGLHLARVKVAGRMAEFRRKRLGHRLNVAERQAYDRDGFLVQENFLPEETFEQLKGEVFGRDFSAREMRQGRAVTRIVPLPVSLLETMPATRKVVESEPLRAAMHYMSSRGGEPTFFIQTILAEASGRAADPQTDLHADTFHSTVKCWLFLQDVGPEDGPFCFVPGSHRLTKERLDWEYKQSLHARDAGGHTAFGSFRVKPEELADLGYGAPMPVAVKANTMVIADTFAFHGRTPSPRSTVRVEINGNLRRNPFLPWTGFDPLALPGIRHNQMSLNLNWLDFRQKHLGKPNVWRDVGDVAVDAAARI
ncbi:phytanoyl-CoA dioxygenase family protein [Breoghania sp.]|uniref:phytanoyl-CoA dioxygenase family protein n=1 Tax=Breoghania sp. TaxID=2065378 RepID=UPI002AA8A953|nr:phytanoyl-CoA dioxygenase family protein [Breoghania sp.]